MIDAVHQRTQFRKEGLGPLFVVRHFAKASIPELKCPLLRFTPPLHSQNIRFGPLFTTPKKK
jgi:hypothetical protein